MHGNEYEEKVTPRTENLVRGEKFAATFRTDIMYGCGHPLPSKTKKPSFTGD